MKLFKQKETYISEKMHICGNIESDADILVDGEIRGNVMSKKRVMLGPTARFEGDIECETALVHGYFSGTIIAKRLIEVKVPGTVVGDLVSESVRVDSGVSLQGNILARNVHKEHLPAATVIRDDRTRYPEGERAPVEE